MRVIGFILAGSIALSLLGAITSVLIAAIGLALIWGVFFRPAETFGLLLFGLITNLLKWNAWAGVALLGLFVMLAWIGEKQEATVRDLPSLTDDTGLSEKDHEAG